MIPDSTRITSRSGRVACPRLYGIRVLPGVFTHLSVIIPDHLLNYFAYLLSPFTNGLKVFRKHRAQIIAEVKYDLLSQRVGVTNREQQSVNIFNHNLRQPAAP